MKRSVEGVFALAVVGLILLMIVPLNPLFLDIFLSLSIGLSVITLLSTIYIEAAVEFSAFPSLLLFLTCFRLGLNIASTRMILTSHQAGALIETFGTFITEDNVAIGLILFFLLTVINFMVVTKGAGRIAEVAARFMLEALPGKQAAIDAQVQARHLTQGEALDARKQMAEEADFYGAMDGASKFIRGEAVASLLITGVNIIAGIAIGIFSEHFPLAECFKLYTCLTIGDGLAAQIPALLVSLGAGIMVTRVSRGSVGATLPKQLVQNPKTLIITALFLFALALLPGMPRLILFSLSGLLAFVGFCCKKTVSAAPAIIEISGLSKGQVEPVRRELEKRLGFPFPEIAYFPKAPLKVLIRGVPISGNLSFGFNCLRFKEHFDEAWQKPSEGIARGTITSEVAKRFCQDSQNAFEYQVVKPKTQVENVQEALLREAHTLLTRQEIAKMVEAARVTNAAVVEELIPKKLSLGELLKVVQNLVKEQVSIQDFATLLEVIADHLPNDVEVLTECVRAHFAPKILAHLLQGSTLHAITLDHEVEEMIVTSYQKTPYGSRFLLRPKILENLEQALRTLTATQPQITPILLSSAKSRRLVRQLLDRHRTTLPVLSYTEVGETQPITSLGVITNDILI